MFEASTLVEIREERQKSYSLAKLILACGNCKRGNNLSYTVFKATRMDMPTSRIRRLRGSICIRTYLNK